MSFRTRLTTFFLLIVVIPMAAMGFLVFRLIDDSQQGKADARANGLASAAASVYMHSSQAASADARSLARSLETPSGVALRQRVARLATEVGILRLAVTVGGRTAADYGSSDAIAPGAAVIRASGRRPERTITLSELTAPQYAAQFSGRGFDVVVRQGSQTLSSTLPAARGRAMPRSGQLRIGKSTYQAVTLSLSGFGNRPVRVTVLSSAAAGGGSVSGDRLVALLFIVGFLILAFGFATLASRALQAQLSEFLRAARRLASGDFSSPVPTRGQDEFAALGEEFNNMSQQLAGRLSDLQEEQERVRRSIRNIGEAFAANLDRATLLELALRTAMEATGGDRGRVTARAHADAPLSELAHLGRLDGLESQIYDSEREALSADGVGEFSEDGLSLATVALGPVIPGGPTHGLITVGRSGRSFSPDDLELLRSLADRATAALTNVNLHYDVQRQAITDDLTGLSTHGHFQQLLEHEMEEVRRYQYPVGLVMLDIDNFKSINDDYGHPQGDVVLQFVAQVLRENSRDPDVAARYGGEELALILPHTDLDGTYVIAERVREAIEHVKVPLVEGNGVVQVTASVGAAASTVGNKEALIAAADNALYVAKRDGKNRTVKADSEIANVLGGR
jgi:diguanylate cyclase (GGDEF)-like protein